MACYQPGYDEERFEATISRNFICSICFNVLRDPVLCPRNQHCFCRACITKFLENSQRCPTCADELTVKTLTEPQRMLKDYLDELNIRCKHVERGCNEIVQLQYLERHEATCEFTPVVCSNHGCGVTVNKCNQVHDESELCEFRKLKCHSCGEMKKLLADMEQRMAKMETNMEKKIVETKTDMKGELEAVDNEMREMKGALIKGFDEIKEALVKMENIKGEQPKHLRVRASGDKEKKSIVVAGGFDTDSVEIFNWSQKSWTALKSLPKKRCGATSFLYNNHMTVAGGFVDNIIRMNVCSSPSISTLWSDCWVKLPKRLAYHRSVLHNDQLIVAGGYDANLETTSDIIHEVQLVPPYTVKNLSRMPEPRQCHGTEIFDKNMLIVGGQTTFDFKNSLSTVLVYDITKIECKQLAPLPYEVSHMATVRWGDNIVVIGGVDRQGHVLDTVIIYNVKTEQHYMLPSMRCKRLGCAAIVIGNNIVVLGGRGEQGRYLKSVETFSFDRYTWEKLPEMCTGRWFPTAVAV